MQDKLNESLRDLEEGLSEPSDVLATLQGDFSLEVLKRCKKVIGWQISDLKGISPLVVRAEVLKLLQACIIYPISDSPWVSPTQVVPKKSGITVVQNEKGEEISTSLTSGLGAQLGEMPFYGTSRNCPWPYHSKKGIEVDKAKVELIVKLPSPTTVKGVRQFLGHAGFYKRFIKDFSKFLKPLCELLAKGC
ncbi:hypothetical protein CK203_054831 [Vitis vinifera]|uniref:Mitochondrial protein n=1 Tax=Vitis vinifera TaxID=29760 RepID=A0A438H4Q8_VITVI|nr:hypothetical protein CK203_054831 [Vitis vinifera]